MGCYKIWVSILFEMHAMITIVQFKAITFELNVYKYKLASSFNYNLSKLMLGLIGKKVQALNN